ncbi:uncharacterized protein MONOS_13577 [Monocercomonoides exilis]|uniref:uncharacterized protein n=1 Tax=Monocercomonoides exilis TaxID=2049356 RepID=UPI003559E95C|nr:hypothetical protein MONOS_13577 [Monocercomonoides exilis]|eukprot:MONOS_13577.1-p1 / transcript=MONOS_13577.1 / gene=MONOS_13577 / organism=Monocercomonoides_exilis_PA203 / gene_product=unspecified product / transcript_product=unspecified product / location=Mono_scaffold00848:19335-21485(+) / protein_length=411 / sequence_SO=supercontig / SO=protein_coding / is_pseudo=false
MTEDPALSSSPSSSSFRASSLHGVVLLDKQTSRTTTKEASSSAPPPPKRRRNTSTPPPLPRVASRCLLASRNRSVSPLHSTPTQQHNPGSRSSNSVSKDFLPRVALMRYSTPDALSTPSASSSTPNSRSRRRRRSLPPLPRVAQLASIRPSESQQQTPSSSAAGFFASPFSSTKCGFHSLCGNQPAGKVSWIPAGSVSGRIEQRDRESFGLALMPGKRWIELEEEEEEDERDGEGEEGKRERRKKRREESEGVESADSTESDGGFDIFAQYKLKKKPSTHKKQKTKREKSEVKMERTGNAEGIQESAKKNTPQAEYRTHPASAPRFLLLTDIRFQPEHKFPPSATLKRARSAERASESEKEKRRKGGRVGRRRGRGEERGSERNGMNNLNEEEFEFTGKKEKSQRLEHNV